jgi:acyl-coenzyme A thioesterase PaaI-like protein
VIHGVNPESGEVTLRFDAQPRFGNHFGAVAGGFATQYIDVASSIAAFAKLNVWCPTIEIKTSFLQPLPLKAFLARATVLRAGRRLAFIDTRLLLEDGSPAVTGSVSVLIPN